MRVYICGPNLRDQSKGSFHVHAADCADLRRSSEPVYAEELKHPPVEVASAVEAAEYVYDNGIMQDGETGADYLHDFHFFPCCDGLPTEAPTVEEEVDLAVASYAAREAVREALDTYQAALSAELEVVKPGTPEQLNLTASRVQVQSARSVLFMS